MQLAFYISKSAKCRKSGVEKSLQSSGPELPALSHVYGVLYHIYEDSYTSVTPRAEDY